MAARRLAYTPSPATRNYILTHLRHNDNENFLANLLQPSRRVAHAHAALRSLNIELAHIRNNVSNEDLGRLRVAHFRAALAHVLATPAPAPDTPVMECLAAAVADFPSVDFRPLHTLLDARERDLAYPAYRTVDDLEAFARDTQGVLIALHAAMLGGPADAVPAAHAAGAAVGLAILLRGTPAHAASRLSYMPAAVSQRLRVASRHLLTGEGDAPKVFAEVAARAEERLRQADARVARLDRAVRPAFWPLRMAEIYLRRLRAAGFNPFDERLQRGLRTTYPLVVQLHLLRCRLFGG